MDVGHLVLLFSTLLLAVVRENSAAWKPSMCRRGREDGYLVTLEARCVPEGVEVTWTLVNDDVDLLQVEYQCRNLSNPEEEVERKILLANSVAATGRDVIPIPQNSTDQLECIISGCYAEGWFNKYSIASTAICVCPHQPQVFLSPGPADDSNLVHNHNGSQSTAIALSSPNPSTTASTSLHYTISDITSSDNHVEGMTTSVYIPQSSTTDAAAPTPSTASYTYLHDSSSATRATSTAASYSPDSDALITSSPTSVSSTDDLLATIISSTPSILPSSSTTPADVDGKMFAVTVSFLVTAALLACLTGLTALLLVLLLLWRRRTTVEKLSFALDMKQNEFEVERGLAANLTIADRKP